MSCKAIKMDLNAIFETLWEPKYEGETHVDLVHRLHEEGKILDQERENYVRLACAADYYDKNVWMHLGSRFKYPLSMIRFLRNRRPKKEKGKLGYQAQALWTADKIPQDKLQEWTMLAGAGDYYDNNPHLHPAEQITDPLELVRFLGLHIDDVNSLGYIAQGLWTAEMIPEDKLRDWVVLAGATDYALTNRRMIGQQIRKAVREVDAPKTHFFYRDKIKQKMDRKLFVRTDNAAMPISDSYFNKVMRCAFELYGNKIIGL